VGKSTGQVQHKCNILVAPASESNHPGVQNQDSGPLPEQHRSWNISREDTNQVPCGRVTEVEASLVLCELAVVGGGCHVMDLALRLQVTR
jgi:hypothetical protein